MFTKFKQEIEPWLRGLIADEVSKLDRDLSNERAALCSTIRVFDTQVRAANSAIDRLSELSHIGEATALHAHIKDLEAHLTGLVGTIKTLHPELVEK